MSISIFLPLRAGSQRVKNKNSKPFSVDGKSLFQLKLAQIEKLLSATDKIKEVVISTNDAAIIEQAIPYLSKTIKLVERPEELCLSTTKVQDLIEYVPTVVSGKHIFWLHVTAPFVNEVDYLKAINEYFEIGDLHDSLMSVNQIKQFIWDDSTRKIINVDRTINPWPNTQDLQPLYEINHAFYISTVENYLKLNDRIGLSPKLFVCEGVKKIDIDWEDDFILAQLIAKGSTPPPSV